MMKHALTLTATIAAFAAPAFAQDMLEDSNGDGVYTMDELLVAYPDLTEEGFAAIDVNGDGVVDMDEFATAQSSDLLPG
ncbi:hypothetical protein LGT41_0013960 [Abyssibius alkaniclasticus]|uniref:hypothetical protein n=1 Tax=Abyssibius alkaniclasticus TaxID=2881234 RepID=UPI002363A149|nr:hypothetical protein [Abyssibius alkaniclasticus]UPH70875.1 hypothetical protein LGT41_0013960 [Abyssibius alkaniclasticus]|tara:strand:- start:1503 stop:1739 length:237 start_codon:yes stop_codon:yes gene_type:complete